MDSFTNKSFLVEIPNFSGPLEVLLDLAKNQKVDLAEISITLLADHFLEFIKSDEKINLETASEYLLMATWLAYLKSKLLLPEDEDDDFQALEIAKRLKLQLKKLELIRILSDQLLKRNRIGKLQAVQTSAWGLSPHQNPKHQEQAAPFSWHFAFLYLLHGQ